MSKTRVYIDGQAGTTGLMLRKRLEGREDLEILTIPEASRRNPAVRREYLNEADFVFLCLPDAASREAVAMIDSPRVRVLDASTAFRTSEDFVYGLPELSIEQREKIQGAKRVSVPGCHASGFVALMAPLVAAGLIPRDHPVAAFSITGYSGGGKQMIAEYEDPDRPAAFSGTRIYALGLSHKHLPEMQKHAGLDFAPCFSPILGDFARGMLVSVPLTPRVLPGRTGAAGFARALADHYAGCRFVRAMPHDPEALPDGGFLDPQALNDTNDMELFAFGGEERVLLVARLDNLGKGASGAAVQNLNLMMGVAEDRGL